MASSRGLGGAVEKLRGRDALFSGVDNGIAFDKIPVTDIDPDKNQVRKTFDESSIEDLAENIRHFGVAQPITVYRNRDRFTIVFGERRWRAAKIAGLEKIPALILPEKPADHLKLQLAENLHRKHLSDVEIYEALAELMETNPELGKQDLAKILGKSRRWVSSFFQLQDPVNRQMMESGLFKSVSDLAHFLSLKAGEATKLLTKAKETGEPITRKDILAAKASRKGLKLALSTKSPYYGKLVNKAREMGCTPEEAMMRIIAIAFGDNDQPKGKQ